MFKGSLRLRQHNWIRLVLSMETIWILGIFEGFIGMIEMRTLVFKKWLAKFTIFASINCHYGLSAATTGQWDNFYSQMNCFYFRTDCAAEKKLNPGMFLISGLVTLREINEDDIYISWILDKTHTSRKLPPPPFFGGWWGPGNKI